jgi:hypothetical protein
MNKDTRNPTMIWNKSIRCNPLLQNMPRGMISGYNIANPVSTRMGIRIYITPT